MAFDYNQLIAPGIGAAASAIGSIPQWQEAQRLKKERERLLKEGPPGMSPIEQEQMAAARAEAASSLAPGYAQEMENNDQWMANIIAAGKQGSDNPSKVMNLLARLNQQGQAARRNLTIRGAQAQRQAKADYRNISMNADARRQRRVENWEADMANIFAKGAQLRASAAMAPLQGAAMFMPLEGFKFGTGTPKPDTTIPSEGTPMTYGENLDYQSQYNRPSAIDNIPRNLPFAPPGLNPQKTGLEREPSMMAAPYTGETEKEFLIRNPLYNTSIRPRKKPSLPDNMLIQSPMRQSYYNFE